jgi:hypothetical protein
MQKKHQKPTKKPNKNTLIIGGVLTVIVLAQVVTAELVYHLLSRQRIADNRFTADMIMTAATNLDRPVSKDAKTGNVYFSEARLSLPPAPDTVGDLLYYYTPDIADIQSELHVTTRSDVSRTGLPLRVVEERDPAKLFSKVPKLQACVRGVMMVYKPKDGLTVGAKKVLASGKTLYFYYEPECTNGALNQYLLNIQSY